MRFYYLALGLLCVWRITHLISDEDGPWDLVVRVRRRLGAGSWGKLFDCFYCLSLWIALPLALYLGESWRERMLLWPALSGGAILAERLTSRPTAGVPAAGYFEDVEHCRKGEEDVLLR